jgi:urease accessory protein UreF
VERLLENAEESGMTQEELRVVAGLVIAYCGKDVKNTGETFVDSNAIGVNAAAMRLLVRYGLMEVDTDAGRRVRARWTAAGRELLNRLD